VGWKSLGMVTGAVVLRENIRLIGRAFVGVDLGSEQLVLPVRVEFESLHHSCSYVSARSASFLLLLWRL
jgi:hypothetical protein